MVICDKDLAPAPLIRTATNIAQRGENLLFTWDPTSEIMMGHMYKLNWYSNYYMDDKHGTDYNHTNDITKQNYCRGTTDSKCEVSVEDANTHVIDGNYIIFKTLSVNRCMQKGTFSNFVVYEKRACTEPDRNPGHLSPCYELAIVDVNVPSSFRLDSGAGGDSTGELNLSDDKSKSGPGTNTIKVIDIKLPNNKEVVIVKPVNPFDSDTTDGDLFD